MYPCVDRLSLLLLFVSLYDAVGRFRSILGCCAPIVFLLEPLLNPGLEKQAVGRVHRLGQRRPVTVTKFVVNQSVESRLLQHLNGTRPATAAIAAQAPAAAAAPAAPPAAPAAAALQGRAAPAVRQAGHLRVDSAALTVEVFDFLLGVTPLHLEVAPADHGEGGGAPEDGGDFGGD